MKYKLNFDLTKKKIAETFTEYVIQTCEILKRAWAESEYTFRW